MRNELEEARGELSTTQLELSKQSDSMAEFLKKRESEISITKRMALEVTRLREEAAREEEGSSSNRHSWKRKISMRSSPTGEQLDGKRILARSPFI